MTGAARRIGAAVARHLAGEGWRVAIHYHEHEREALALAGSLPGAIALPGDLVDPATSVALVDATRDGFGMPLAGLVNSASLFRFDAPPHIDPALLAEHHAVNLAAPALLASALASQDDLAEGAAVNLLDQKLANPNPDFFSYSAAKFALGGATIMLSQAFAPRIRVNAVSPGITLPSGDQTEAEFRAVASDNLLRRPIAVDDIARAVAWLLEARGVMGQNLFVDCGQRFVPSARDVMFGATHG